MEVLGAASYRGSPAFSGRLVRARRRRGGGQRLSLRDIETARRARRQAVRRGISERIPATAARPHPADSEPPAGRRRRRLRVYEEGD